MSHQVLVLQGDEDVTEHLLRALLLQQDPHAEHLVIVHQLQRTRAQTLRAGEGVRGSGEADREQRGHIRGDRGMRESEAARRK